MFGGNGGQTATHSVGVVIPCLNEEQFIRRTLESVVKQNGPVEIIVVDGGSDDRSREIAREYGCVLRSERGRARQMNVGAAAAQSETLLFLHADTTLPRGAFDLVRRSLEDPRIEGGAFRLRFDRSTSLLQFYSACTRLRSPLLCFGDRGLFIRRAAFRRLGGFPNMALFEDLEMARMLNRQGGFVFLDECVTTSARRFLKSGPLRQQLRNAYLWARYLLGTDPHRLTHLYPYGTTDERPR